MSDNGYSVYCNPPIRRPTAPISLRPPLPFSEQQAERRHSLTHRCVRNLPSEDLHLISSFERTLYL
jgi:hypothetical protein